MIHAESAGNPKARSNHGAIGLMQLMPATAKDLGVNPWDATQNIYGGTLYLAKMLKMFKGDITLAIAAYNAGPGTVRRAGNKIPNRVPPTRQMSVRGTGRKQARQLRPIMLM